MDEYDIAQEVRLERKVHEGSFLLLEGDTDIKRFGRFIDNAHCSIVNCYGRRKAILATKMLYDEGFVGALAVIDADFDRLTGKLEEHEGLIYSDAHDFDLDWAGPEVVDRYLAEVGEVEKCSLHGTSAEIIQKIIKGLKPISVAKFMNHLRKISYKLSDIDPAGCYSNFLVDMESYVSSVFRGRPSVSNADKDALKGQIILASARTYDLKQLTNGHDFHCALGASLRNDLGSRRDVHTWGREVAIHLRLAFTATDLERRSVYRTIADWAHDNSPFHVFPGA